MFGQPSQLHREARQDTDARPGKVGNQNTADEVLYLSKFSPGLFFLHSSVCYEVVEHLSCEWREEHKRPNREVTFTTIQTN